MATLKPTIRYLAAIALIALLVPVAGASAAQTTIGFDDLSAGTEVTGQYAALGLRFGRAAELAQPKTTGDCGNPTVESGAAASGANYAVLGKCDPAVETERGSFGALLTARPSLSVKVKDLSPGGGATAELVGFAAGGEEVAKATVAADTSGWKELTATASKGAIAYFVVRAATATDVAIDDLSFETPPAEEEHKTGPPPPPPPTPPVARIALETPSPTAGAPIVLSGAGSSPGSGRIISYAWDFNDDGKIDTSTGTHPTAEAILPPGIHTVGLTVTTSTGEKSSSLASVTVTKSGLHPPDGGEGECLPKLEVGDAELLAECIQKLSGGGYVIAGPRVSINGMVLVPKSGGFLKIRTVKDFAIAGTKTELYGGQVYIELPNTPIGNVVFGERDLEAEPMALEIHSGLGSSHVLIYHGAALPVASAADKPDKTFLMAIGIGKECSAGEKKAGCCPPKNALTACATLPGNFPLEGQVDVYLTNKGQALFEVQVGLDLKSVNFEATGSLQIIANLETGIELSSLQFTIGEASLAPIFKVKNASFTYYFPESPEESKRDSWQAKGTLTFGEEVVELAAELAFKKGEFQSAAMKFKVAHGGVPIYPGILLNEIGASVGVHPLAFGGSLGASIAELLELELEFKFREATSEEFGFFGGKGTLSLKGDQIATLAADVYTDSYVDAQVTFDLHFPFESKEPIVEISGGAGFWDEPTSGLWQAKGNVFMKIWILSAEVAALVNNKYAAGCLHVGAEGIFGGGVQGRYSFEDGSVSGGLFGNSNCSDQLKPYSQKPLAKHTGGFVKEESLRRLPGAVGLIAAAGSSEAFTLPAGTDGQELRILSTSGTPAVRFRSPDGKEYATPTASGQIVNVPGEFISVVGPKPHETLVLLKRPKGGEWLVAPTAGSPAIARLETGEDVAPASVKARVSRSRGHRYALTYRIQHFVAGTKVRFVERGRDSTHVLGTVSGPHGRLTFVPEEALGRSRTILAYMVDAEGAVVREIKVGSYQAPGVFRPARPKRLRLLRKGSGAVLSWAAVSGSRSYRIKVRGSDGRLLTLTRKAGNRSVTIPNVLPFESFTASVTAVGGKNLLAGPAAKIKLAALKPRRAPRKRHH